ncbi:MAG: TolC family protein, partial [Armatimonadota bacterium]
MKSYLRYPFFALLVAVAGFSQAQSTLDLNSALGMAKKNNGTVRSAQLNYEAARAAARGSFAAFLPSVTPSYLRTETQITGNDSTAGTSAFLPGQSALVTLDWTFLDNGRRRLNFRQFSLEASSQEANALQTLRTVLFNVHSSYFDALRAQELLKVQEAQLKRANEILEQTKVRVQLKDAAQKDILQASADSLNAQASYLQSKNEVETTRNTLKALIVWEGT